MNVPQQLQKDVVIYCINVHSDIFLYGWSHESSMSGSCFNVAFIVASCLTLMIRRLDKVKVSTDAVADITYGVLNDFILVSIER